MESLRKKICCPIDDHVCDNTSFSCSSISAVEQRLNQKAVQTYQGACPPRGTRMVDTNSNRFAAISVSCWLFLLCALTAVCTDGCVH